MKNKIPVILDTDIGGDIDDTWALAMLLRCPELELKLVTSATADTVYRAKICAKILERSGKYDIPVGIGLRGNSDGPRERQLKWVENYSLARYPGIIHDDGVQAMINVVNGSSKSVTIICIGPFTNIAELLHRAPQVAAKVNLVAMAGSINKAAGDKDGAIAEFNVKQDIPAAQAAFNSLWHSMTITPLDTCGSVALEGDLYKEVLNSEDRLIGDVIENYRIWSNATGWTRHEQQSTILYDTVAVHLAYSTDFLTMQQMRLIVCASGYTKPDYSGNSVNVAIAWSDKNSFLESLAKRLSGKWTEAKKEKRGGN